MTSPQTLVNDREFEDNLLLEENYSWPHLNGHTEQDVRLAQSACPIKEELCDFGQQIACLEKKQGRWRVKGRDRRINLCGGSTI